MNQSVRALVKTLKRKNNFDLKGSVKYSLTVKRTGAKIPSAKSVEGYGVVEGDILILQKSDALSHGKKTGAYSKHVVPTRQTIKTLDDFMMV